MAMRIEELQVLISANADQFKNELVGINQRLDKFGANASKVSKGVGGTFTKSLITANVITGILNRSLSAFQGIVGDTIRTTQQFENALIGLETIAGRKLGQEAIPLATQAAKDLASDGLMSVTDAANGLKNLLASNFNLDQAVNLMNTFKDSAAFGRQSALQFGESIVSATEGIKNGNSILVDNAGITKNLSIILQEAGFAQNDLMKATTDASVRQALYNGLLKEGNLFQGDAAKLANTTSGQLANLKVMLTTLKVTLGQFIKPIQSVVLTSLMAFFGGVTSTLGGAENSIKDFSIKVAGYMLAIVRVIGSLLSRLPIIGKNFQNLANLSLNVSTAQGKTANAIGNTADAIQDATGNAEKLKKSLLGLAGFDQMNTLQTPDASGGGAGSDIALPTITGGGGVGSESGLGTMNAEINKVADDITARFDEMKKKFDELMQNPVVAFFADVVKVVGLAAIGFKLLGPVIGLVNLALGPLAAILSPIKAGLMAIGGLLAGLSAPVLIVVGVVALLVAGFVLLYNSSESFRNSIDQLVSGALTWIKDNIGPVFEQIGAKVQELVAVFQEKWPAIQEAIQPLIDSISNFLVGALQLLGDVIDWLWKTILKPLVDFILANIVPAFEFVLDVVTKVIEIFVAVATPIIDLLIPVLKQLWEIVKTVFESILKIISDVWNGVVKPIFQAIKDFIEKLIIPVLQNLFNIASKVFEGIKSVVERVWNGIMDAIRPVVEWIDTNVMPPIRKIADGIGEAFQGAKNVVEGIWDGLMNIIKGGINWIIDRINEFIGHINNLIQGVSDVASAIPGGSPIDFRVGYIPRLAKGGVIDSPTIAMLGETRHQEVVLPLEENTGWMDKLADKIGGGNGPIHLTLNVGGKTIVDEVIEGINDRALASGDVILNI